MSIKHIPEFIDPFRHADQNLTLEGSVLLAGMTRLPIEIDVANDKADISLTFGVDDQKIIYIKGHMHSCLTLQCQRCLKPMVYEIMSDFVLGVVNNLDQAKKLPDHYEPALVNEGKLSLFELVEDELILNLPIIPRHDASVCSVALPLFKGEIAEELIENPFLALASLKQKQ